MKILSRRDLFFLVIAVCFLSVFAVPVSAIVAEATFNMDVPPGRWKALRVRNLPQGAVIGVEAQTNGAVAVAFVGQSEYRQFPSITRPLFKGQFDRKFSFSVTIPSAGDYYLVFDNRPGTEARAISLTVRGARGNLGSRELEGNATQGSVNEDSIRKLQSQLDEFQRKLSEIFVFEPFAFEIKQCGAPKAFASASGVVLCSEYAQMLYVTLKDEIKTSNALLFTVFHELGHILLAQWKSPVFDNEEVADEFATATMILLGLKDRVRAKAEFFAKRPAEAEAIAKAFKDDRHPLSVQRARNIIRWANDPKLLRKWQTLFVPHMQTAALEKLLQRNSPLFDRKLVEKELASRQ
jgi:hypothetical protein